MQKGRLFKTKGIALNYIKYRDTSIIAKIYTEEFGLQSYVQNGVRSSKSHPKMALFQPLTLLDLVVYYKEDQEIHRISEIRCNHPYYNLQVNRIKILIGTFIAEILTKSIHEGDVNKPLFGFLEEMLCKFDSMKSDFENFHVQFLFAMMQHLGFQPHSSHEFLDQLINFDPRNAILYEDKMMNEVISDFLGNGNTNKINGRIRSQLLQLLVDFYHLHIEKFGEVKSLKILREL